ncbi:kinase-like domain, beta-lactamase/transpeptidase-like protein [Tanacetum coccineum]
MKEADFSHVVEAAWKKEVRSVPPDCRFWDRLKNFKTSLRIWSKDRFEKEMEYGNMMRQKARVKWDVEGDENSNFFHSYVKRRNNKCNLRGLMVNEVWCEDPRIDKISEEDTRSLGKVFSEGEEVTKEDSLRAVMGFWEKMVISKGGNASFVIIIPKVPDPIGLGDFRPISLIRCYHKIIAKILVEMVKKVVGMVVGEGQNAFIKGRYILDVLISNETMEFLKKKKENGLIFKVDFEKAYDSINWSFLITV